LNIVSYMPEITVIEMLKRAARRAQKHAEA
jgi:hypothetical protein